MYSEKIYLYEGRKDVSLTCYIQDDAESLLGGCQRPAVLICPGGAYMKCATQEAEPVALRFAAMGYHCFVLRYSTYFSLNPSQSYPCSMEEVERHSYCVYPTPMREIGQAFLIIRELAGRYLIDMNKIALCGFSAGAHNCAMYACSWDKPVITDFFAEDREIFRPAAVILGYIAGDYYFAEGQADGEKDKTEDMFFPVSYMALAGKTCLTAEDKELFAPSKHVDSMFPPAFLWATSTDQLVSVRNTIILAQALAEQKIPFECHIFEGGGHGLSLATQESAKKQAQINPDVARWTSLAESWLLKRFQLHFMEEG